MNKKVVFLLLCVVVGSACAMKKSFTETRFSNIDKYPSGNFFTFDKPIKIYGVSGCELSFEDKKNATSSMQSLPAESSAFKEIVNQYKNALPKQCSMVFVHFDHKTNQLHCACESDGVVFVENNGEVETAIECGSPDLMAYAVASEERMYKTANLSENNRYVIVATPNFHSTQKGPFMQKFKKNRDSKGDWGLFVNEYGLAKILIFELNWQDKIGGQQGSIAPKKVVSSLGSIAVNVVNMSGNSKNEELLKVQAMTSDEMVKYLVDKPSQQSVVDNQRERSIVLQPKDESYLSQMKNWWDKQSARAKQAAAALSVAAIFGGIYYYTHTR